MTSREACARRTLQRVHFDDPEDLTKKFEALASGGQITMPVQDTFWGARFGMLTDAYGIRWMFNCVLHGR